MSDTTDTAKQKNNAPAGPFRLLICSLGGTPEPVVQAIEHWLPERVRFVVTRETETLIEQSVLPLAEQRGLRLSPSHLDPPLVLTNGEDFAGCLEKLRELTRSVEEWLARGENYEVVVDFTGGTKCMSAALALRAHRWPCTFSYIGGTQRNKDGVGVVVTGSERVVHYYNPWDYLGEQAIEDALVLFDQRAFAAAIAKLKEAQRNVQSPSRKRELQSVVTLCHAYDCWDRFQHKDANNHFENLRKCRNDLRALIPSERRFDTLWATLEQHHNQVKTLAQATAKEGGRVVPTREHVVDLLANAQRRAEQCRYDDAVARLYRAIEAFAQWRLHHAHGIDDTGAVPLDVLPPEMRRQKERDADDGKVKLALQDDYRLLRHLGDPAGERFAQLQLDDIERSPLSERNNSILAHGFKPISKDGYERLWKKALELTDVDTEELPVFPKLL